MLRSYRFCNEAEALVEPVAGLEPAQANGSGHFEMGSGNDENAEIVEKFFSEKMSHGKAEDYLIRENRQPVPRDYVLQEGDRATITPTKIEGAE